MSRSPATARRVAAAGILAALLAIVAGGAPAAPGDVTTRASALVARVSTGSDVVSAGGVEAPPAGSLQSSWAYPEDGSIVRVGVASASVAAQSGVSSSSQAIVDVSGVSLFAGEVIAGSVSLRASAAAGGAGASAETGASTVQGLVVLGQPVGSGPQQLALGDWGTLEVLAGSSELGTSPAAGAASVIGLRVRLTAEHGGLPAGAEIVVGDAVASATAAGPTTTPSTGPQAPGAPRPTAPPVLGDPGAPKPGTPSPSPASGRRATPPPGESPTQPVSPSGGGSAPLRDRPRVPVEPVPEPGRSVPGRPDNLVRPIPTGVAPRLSNRGYVFPVYGPASFGNTFGAARYNVSGGWHHGEDITAPTGAPLLAVADGTLFSVGWNDIGGWRVWLRDDGGNEFYYAHLSAFSTLAREGARVQAGDVIGFVGDSGDATGTPHLHFEIHPSSLLGYGYDGVIAPYPYLLAWQRAEDVSFSAGRAFVSVAGGVPVVVDSKGIPRPLAAAPAGAILLEASDISRASGLVPGALERSLTGDRAGEATLAVPGR